jgi:uncharacterized integral membrane protein
MQGLQEQLKEAGIHYPPSYDVAYRAGLLLQGLALAAFALLYLLGSPLGVYALLLFEGGVALSSIFLLVWKQGIKRFILRALFVGLFIQLGALLVGSSTAFLVGLGFVLVAAAGLVGKEAYCFGYLEGWLLVLAYPVAVLPNIFGFSGKGFNVFMAFLAAGLMASLLRRKLKQPLLKGCESDVCGLPQEGGSGSTAE